MDVGRNKDPSIAPAYAQGLDCSQLKINRRPGEWGCWEGTHSKEGATGTHKLTPQLNHEEGVLETKTTVLPKLELAQTQISRCVLWTKRCSHCDINRVPCWHLSSDLKPRRYFVVVVVVPCIRMGDGPLFLSSQSRHLSADCLDAWRVNWAPGTKPQGCPCFEWSIWAPSVLRGDRAGFVHRPSSISGIVMWRNRAKSWNCSQHSSSGHRYLHYRVCNCRSRNLQHSVTSSPGCPGLSYFPGTHDHHL